MVVKNIKYVDYDGNERNENFYFHLTQADIVKMEMGVDGGLTRMINKIIETRDTTKILPIFEDFILKSYGEKSDDGRRFIKSPELAKAFTETPAYSQLFMEFITKPSEFANFVNALAEGAQTPDSPKVLPASEPNITPVN